MDGRGQREVQELTPAESQAAKACLSSSIWTHSLPMSLGSVALLRFIEMKTNYKPKMWAGLAMAVSGAVGGRLMAVPGCIRKVVAENPDGNLAKIMAEMKAGKQRDRDGMFAPDTSDQVLVADVDDTVSRPLAPPPPPSQAPVLESSSFNKQTYDDLRRRNREDYISKKRPPTHSAAAPEQQVPVDQLSSGSSYSDPAVSSYSDPPSPYMESLPLIPSPTLDEEPKVRRKKRVNVYGDEVED